MQDIINFVDELKSTNSANLKKITLEKYKNNEEIRTFLYYTFNPYYKFWITNDVINKYDSLKWIWREYNNIYDLLDALKERDITWHMAIESVLLMQNKLNDNEKEILKMILDKSVSWNISISLINKVFVNEWQNLKSESNFIPTFNVSLATKLEDCLKSDQTELDFQTELYVGSRKLDGIRCIGIFNENGTDIRFYSREWNEFYTLWNLKYELLELVKEKPFLINYVFDGEMCIIDENWNEDFKKVVWDIKRKEYTIEKPLYKIFDLIPKNDFYNEYSDLSFIERYNYLTSLNIKWKTYETLEHFELDSSKFKELLEIWRNNKWEWLILRKAHSKYEWKRTKNMIKVKDFLDAEYEVMNVEFWTMPMLNSNWIMEEVSVLAAVHIIHKWNKVKVWSWFNSEEKLFYKNNPNEIIWKRITVKYFEESQDKDWNYSLRFPTFHGIRDYE